MAKKKKKETNPVYSEKLQEVLNGCKFTIVGDPIARQYIIDEPGGLLQYVYKYDKQGLKEVIKEQGSVSHSQTHGDKLVIQDTVVGMPVHVEIDVKLIAIL